MDERTRRYIEEQAGRERKRIRRSQRKRLMLENAEMWGWAEPRGGEWLRGLECPGCPASVVLGGRCVRCGTSESIFRPIE